MTITRQPPATTTANKEITTTALINNIHATKREDALFPSAAEVPPDHADTMVNTISPSATKLPVNRTTIIVPIMSAISRPTTNIVTIA